MSRSAVRQYFLTTGNGPWGTRAWSYDKIGNRLSEAKAAEPAQSYAYASPGHNPKVSTVTPSPGQGAGSWTFTYDAAGNQTQIAETDAEGPTTTAIFDFSAESRLSALRSSDPNSRSDFLYDGRGFLGEGALTQTGMPNDFVRVTPTYSTEGTLLSLREERSWSGGPGDNGEDIFLMPGTSDERTNVLYFAGRPVCQINGTEITYLTTDHLGTPVLATNQAGAAIWAGGLEPFGRIWTAGQDNPDPESAGTGFGGLRGRKGREAQEALSRLSADKIFLRYPGQWASDVFRVEGLEGDTYYNVHRWYQQGLGRYERPDPIGLDALRRGDLFGLPPAALYSYVDANPLSRSDVLGRDWVDWIPSFIPGSKTVKCTHYYQQCDTDVRCCMKDKKFASLYSLDEEEMAEVLFNAGGHALPQWTQCFENLDSCKKMISWCGRVAIPSRPPGSPVLGPK